MAIGKTPTDAVRLRVVADVRAEGGGWAVTDGDSWTLFCSREEAEAAGYAPRVGDEMVTIGDIGMPVRGIFIAGRTFRYLTSEQDASRRRAMVDRHDEERRAEFERKRPELDAQYMALPEPLRRRIDRFRANNHDWRWRFESYEMFVSTQAAAIARTLGSVDAVDAWKRLSWEEQKATVPALSADHSGNTFSAAVFLARQCLGAPSGVPTLPGAIESMVGTDDFLGGA